MYDRIIKGGTVVDGTGAVPFTADVAIQDGVIAEVGRVTAAARETVDANGLLVTPGWVDIHSHYDGQVTWDSQLAPSFWHGVATVLMGNCGVGFAPVRPDKHDFLIGLMEGVEDIPGTALAEGINWEWETFPEYLDALSSKSWALDIAAQMPHGALRAYVMGDRAGRKEPATEADIAEMVRLTAQAQDAGSFGFSTSRTVFHKAVDGVPVPGTYAEADEIYAIAETLARSGHGVLEVAPTTPDESSDAPATELAWMADVSAKTGCPITFLCLQHNQRPNWWAHQLEFCDAARTRGAVVVPQVFCRAISVMLGLRSKFHPFIRGQTFKSLKDLPFAEMVRRLKADPELRRRMALEGVANVYGADDPSDPFAGQMNLDWSKVYALGNPPEYEPTPDRSIAAIAATQARDPREVVLDIMLEDGGESFIQYPFMGFANGDLGPVYDMLANPHSIPGAADGGAHVSTICDGGIPTFMLTHWVRDRTAGQRFPLEYIVKKQTADTAALYGMRDRGMLKPGLRADINIIDFTRLGFDPPRMIRDLPAGGPRLMQKATGYVATMVAGQIIQRDGEDTGLRPGKLIRSRARGVTMAELVIRGGTIVDGSGGEPFESDIVVTNGKIAAIERHTAQQGAEEIDAKGRIVTPGFVDLHTHYDGQATWDSRLAPSSLHGVTTAIMGNCGVGFAPCRPEQRELLIRLMEGIEDIPNVVLTEGIPWNWESFPEYLDALAARRFDIDIGGYIPHAALRVFAMGERASKHKAATTDDLARMAPLVREAMAAGAFGIGTSRTIFHRSSDGQSVPTLKAGEEELTMLATAAHSGGQGLLQYAVDWEDVETTFALIRRVAERSGCPVAFSLVQANGVPDNWRKVLELTRQANDDGLPISVQVMPRAIGMLLSHSLTLNPFVTTQTYKKLAYLPLAARLTELRKSEVRARIIGEATDPNPKNLLATFTRDFDRIYPLNDPPNYEPAPETSIAAEARRRGIPPEELAYDLLLEKDGRTMLFVATVNYVDKSLDATREMLVHRDTVPGLGDGGAHLGVMCDATYSTFMLTHWARDRSRGEKLGLPFVVKSLTSDTAKVIGLNDRGLLRAGYRADLNVIDFDRLRLGVPEIRTDLPAGGRRIIQTASGYDATVVHGQVTARNGIANDALPGRLVRGPQAAPIRTN